MTKRAWLLAGLIVSQAAAYYWLRNAVAYPALMSVAAVLGASGRFHIALPRDRRRILFLALALVYTLWWYLRPGEAPRIVPVGLFGTFPADAMAYYLLLIQVLHFYLRDAEAPKTPLFTAILPLAGALTMCGAAYVFAAVPAHRVMAGILAVFAGFHALYCGALRRDVAGHVSYLRYALLGAILAIALASGAAASTLLARNFSAFDQLIARLVQPPALMAMPGLGDKARLDSVRYQKTQKEMKVIARIESEETPGYLRARAFEYFDGREWHLPQETWPLPQAGPPPDVLRTRGDALNYYRLPESGAQIGAADRLDVWTGSGVKGLVLAPLDTAWVATPQEKVASNESRIVSFPDAGPGGTYRLATAALPATALLDELRKRYTRLPENVDPRVRQLAERLFSRARNSRDKVKAVLDYFHGNYEYQLGITVPPNTAPLTYFLLEQPAAHCEYFASGAALLLRLGGVPCRYVTGLMVTEQHPYGGYWVGRNRNAHAWIEAWDGTLGWQTFEPTPAAGVTEEPAPGGLAALLDFLRHQAHKAMAAVKNSLWPAIKTLLGTLSRLLLDTWAGLCLLAVATALVGAWLVRGRRRLGRRRTTCTGNPELRRLLRRMDRRVGRFGFARAPSETLHQFARRVANTAAPGAWEQQAAVWYTAYAAHRYEAPGHHGIADLAAGLEACLNPPREAGH